MSCHPVSYPDLSCSLCIHGEVQVLSEVFTEQFMHYQNASFRNNVKLFRMVRFCLRFRILANSQMRQMYRWPLRIRVISSVFGGCWNYLRNRSCSAWIGPIITLIARHVIQACLLIFFFFVLLYSNGFQTQNHLLVCYTLFSPKRHWISLRGNVNSVLH